MNRNLTPVNGLQFAIHQAMSGHNDRMKKGLFHGLECIGTDRPEQNVELDIWSGSTLFATHATDLDPLKGSQIDLVNF